MEDTSWLEDGFLTTSEAADQLNGVTPDDIAGWCRRDRIRHVKEPTSGRWLVSEEDIKSIAKFCGSRDAKSSLVQIWAIKQRVEKQ